MVINNPMHRSNVHPFIFVYTTSPDNGVSLVDEIMSMLNTSRARWGVISSLYFDKQLSRQLVTVHVYVQITLNIEM